MVGLGGMPTRGKITVPLSPLRQNITENYHRRLKLSLSPIACKKIDSLGVTNLMTALDTEPSSSAR